MKTKYKIIGSLCVVGVLASSMLLTRNSESRRFGPASTTHPALVRYPKPDETPPTEQEELILTTTVQWILHHEKVGRFWMNMLDDKAKPSKDRAYAAKVLGRMRFRPAIPVLIANIEVVDESVPSFGDRSNLHIVIRSLGQYGDAAVPDLVHAYLDTTVNRDGRDFLEAIKAGKSEKFAITYLTGLHALRDKRVTHEILQEFCDRLDK